VNESSWKRLPLLRPSVRSQAAQGVMRPNDPSETASPQAFSSGAVGRRAVRVPAAE
jgi:hypothetical protein